MPVSLHSFFKYAIKREYFPQLGASTCDHNGHYPVPPDKVHVKLSVVGKDDIFEHNNHHYDQDDDHFYDPMAEDDHEAEDDVADLTVSDGITSIFNILMFQHCKACFQHFDVSTLQKAWTL